jgi:hypothetical protein
VHSSPPENSAGTQQDINACRGEGDHLHSSAFSAFSSVDLTNFFDLPFPIPMRGGDKALYFQFVTNATGFLIPLNRSSA